MFAKVAKFYKIGHTEKVKQFVKQYTPIYY